MDRIEKNIKKLNFPIFLSHLGGNLTDFETPISQFLEPEPLFDYFIEKNATNETTIPTDCFSSTTFDRSRMVSLKLVTRNRDLSSGR